MELSLGWTRQSHSSMSLWDGQLSQITWMRQEAQHGGAAEAVGSSALTWMSQEAQGIGRGISFEISCSHRAHSLEISVREREAKSR